MHHACIATQVELVDEVARATEEYEVSSSLLTQLVERPTVEARLSTAMAKRNMKIGDVASHWDKDHDGMVSKAEVGPDPISPYYSVSSSLTPDADPNPDTLTH